MKDNMPDHNSNCGFNSKEVIYYALSSNSGRLDDFFHFLVDKLGSKENVLTIDFEKLLELLKREGLVEY